MCKILTVGALAVLFLAAGPLEAQTTTDAGTGLAMLLYGPSGQGVADKRIVQAVVDMLANGTTSFPIATSSGAFSFALDPAGGTFLRRTDSFGPVFAERPLTNGRKHLNVALNYQRTEFDSVAGQSLDSLKAVSPRTTYGDYTGPGAYESSLKVVTDRTIVTATYGLSDSVDVGVVVPFGRTRVSGSSLFERTGVNGVVQGQQARETVSGSSSGIADIIVRTKVAFLSSAVVDLAADVDVHLPTGDPNRLLGIGVFQTKGMIIAAGTLGRASAHLNLGYTWSGSDDSPRLSDQPSGPAYLPIRAFDEFSYTAGADIVAARTVTLIADVIGHRMVHADTLSFLTDAGYTFFETNKDVTLNQVLGAIGAKFQLGTRSVIAASILFPLNDGGIKPRVTPFVGIERTF